MPTSWPSVVRADYDADKAVTVDRASAIRDRSEALIRAPFTYRFPTPVSAADERPIEILDFWLGRTLHCRVAGRILSGDGTSVGRGRVLIKSQANGILLTGDWVNFTDTGSGEDIDLTVLLTAAALSGEIPSFGHTEGQALLLRAEVEKTAGPGTAQLLTGGLRSYLSD